MDLIEKPNAFAVNLQVLQEFDEKVGSLLKLPYYAKMGRDGILAILAKSASLKIDPLEALNGGLYYVSGKVEMSAAMMNQLIRAAGHSIKKDPKSDESICILHGKRGDNGDDWMASFSIMEAKRACLVTPSNVWSKYPSDMLFARALSRLARQLFPDVIKGCYTEGEIKASKDNENLPAQTNTVEVSVTPTPQQLIDELKVLPWETEQPVTEYISFDQLAEIVDSLGDDKELYQKALDKGKINNFSVLEKNRFAALMTWIEKQKAKNE